jgi:hypothetical protein
MHPHGLRYTKDDEGADYRPLGAGGHVKLVTVTPIPGSLNREAVELRVRFQIFCRSLRVEGGDARRDL